MDKIKHTTKIQYLLIFTLIYKNKKNQTNTLITNHLKIKI